MKPIIGVFFAVLFFFFPAVSESASNATPYDVYVALDTTFGFQRLELNTSKIPSGLLGDPVLERAYKLNIADFGAASTAYHSGTVTYKQFAKIIEKLFYLAAPIVGPEGTPNWELLKSKLSENFGIDVDSVEAVNRGLSSYKTLATDPVSNSVLTLFSDRARLRPLIWAKAQRLVVGDTARFSLNVSFAGSIPIKAFRVTIADVEMTPNRQDFINTSYSVNFFPAVGFSGRTTFSRPNTIHYAIGGMMGGDNFIQNPNTFSVGEISVQSKVGNFHFSMFDAMVFDTSGFNDVHVWALQIPIVVGIQGDLNLDGIITLSDAILASKWLLRGTIPPSVQMVDLNHNGVFDPDDVLLIFYLGIWGGNSPVPNSNTNNLASSNSSSLDANQTTVTEGIINVRQKTDGDALLVSVGFSGNLDLASRFGGSFVFNNESFAFSGATLENPMAGISDFAVIGNKINVLNYFQEFNGKIVTLKFQRIKEGDLNLSLAPLSADNFFQFGEKVKIDFSAPTGITVGSILPTEFSVSQNYPNPFNPTTSIKYSVPYAQHATLKVYDMLGKEIATLVDEVKSAGVHNANFNALNLPSGTYLYRFQSGSFSETKKLMLLK
jgi:hypothetical protein